MDFKSLANYMGGIKALLDRGSRRSLERNLTQGTSLMMNGRSPESRAKGAALYLKTLEEMNVQNPNDNSPLSRMINLAHQVGPTNLQQVQGASINRVVRSSNRLNGRGSLASDAMRQLAGQNTLAAATSAFEQEYKPENRSLIAQANGTFISTTKLFNNSLKDSIDSLSGFVDALKLTKEGVTQAFATRKTVQEDTAAKQRANTEAHAKAFASPFPRRPPITEQDSGFQNLGANYGGQYLIPAASAVFGYAKGGRSLRGMGASLGRGGVATSIYAASEYGRSKWSDPDSTVGVAGGIAGAGLAGLTMAGPIGAAISMGAYGWNERNKASRRLSGGIAYGGALDEEHSYNMGQDITRFNNPTLTLKQLTNQARALENQKATDSENTGWGSRMSKILGIDKRQFGSAQEERLSKINQQRDALSGAIQSGDSSKILEVMQQVQSELQKINENTKNTKNQNNETANQASAINNNAIYVDINANDAISRIAEKINELQSKVNMIVNKNNPKPAVVNSAV